MPHVHFASCRNRHNPPQHQKQRQKTESRKGARARSRQGQCGAGGAGAGRSAAVPQHPLHPDHRCGWDWRRGYQLRAHCSPALRQVPRPRPHPVRQLHRCHGRQPWGESGVVVCLFVVVVGCGLFWCCCFWGGGGNCVEVLCMPVLLLLLEGGVGIGLCFLHVTVCCWWGVGGRRQTACSQLSATVLLLLIAFM